jgi:hypothetical protein
MPSKVDMGRVWRDAEGAQHWRCQYYEFEFVGTKIPPCVDWDICIVFKVDDWSISKQYTMHSSLAEVQSWIRQDYKSGELHSRAVKTAAQVRQEWAEQAAQQSNKSPELTGEG